MGKLITAAAVKAAIRAQKDASFAARGGFVPLGLPGLEQLEVSWAKVGTRLGYTAHEFVLRGPTGRRSPQRENGMMHSLATDAQYGRVGTRFDIAYLLGEGATLNEAAEIVRARGALATASE